MSENILLKRAADEGYIVAWKYKYKHEAGKVLDRAMTYGEAKKRAEELSAQAPDKTFWAEKAPATHKAH